MKAPVRTQADELGDTYSLATGIHFDQDKDRTRQEFAQDADINELLARYGVTAATRVPTWGTQVDYDIDLTSAYQTIDELKQAWPQLPEDIRRQFGSWGALLEAIDTGQVSFQDIKEPEQTPDTEPNSEEATT